MGKSPVKVFVRVRPTASPFSGIKCGAKLIVHIDRGSTGVSGSKIAVELPKKDISGPNNSLENLDFQFSGVLENATQATVFSDVAQDLVDNTLQGYNSTVFCYGQTGAGKTFTMSGQSGNYQQRGIVPRALAHVFREVDTRVDRVYNVRVSYLEIYNEQLYDLLSDNPAIADHLHCMDDESGLVIKGLTQKLIVPDMEDDLGVPQVRSEEDALAFFFLGEQARSTAMHALNANSSRSHVVFSIHMDIRASADAKERAVLSKINLVDLAGSERTKKSGSGGQAMLEAQFINKSLSFLEMTVNALARKEAHISFRQCKLTAVLKDALGGNSKTAMIANIWPEERYLEETVSTMRFGVRVQALTTDNRQHESSDPVLLLKRYERQIKELKQELAMRDTLNGRARIRYGDLSEADLRDLYLLAKEFLEGHKEVDDLPLHTVKTIKEAFTQCRSVYQTVKSRAPQSGQDDVNPGQGDTADLAPDDEDETCVGEPEVGTGFNVGEAPLGARPESIATAELSETHRIASQLGENASEKGQLHSAVHEIDRDAAFKRYKHSAEGGRCANEELKRHVGELKAAKGAMKQLAEQMNIAKKHIDALQGRLSNCRLSSPPDPSSSVVDREEGDLLAELKAEKLKYRQAFDLYKQRRMECDSMEAGVAEARKQLLEDFEAWLSHESISTVVDELDPQEEYEALERERIMSVDPEMTSYVAAQKRSRGADERLQRFAGDKARAMHARKVEQMYKMNFGMTKP